MSEFWKIMRILTTNQCNYRCLYCHNEGQKKENNSGLLSFENFSMIFDMIEGMGFQEIRFSGGEPLVNPRTIEMIEWADKHSDYEIGLASNGSLITDDIAKRLGKTRTMVTLHFPSVKDDEYLRVTGKSGAAFFDAIKRLERNNVKHSFNFVLYPETIGNIYDVVEYTLNKGKRVKLLPFIERGFNNYSSEIIEKVSKKLDENASSKERNNLEGITTWRFENGGKVKMIDSPCYSRNILMCREYGELRLLPDLSLQKCIFDNGAVSLSGHRKEEMQQIITDLWQSFDKCL